MLVRERTDDACERSEAAAAPATTPAVCDIFMAVIIKSIDGTLAQAGFKESASFPSFMSSFLFLLRIIL